MKRNINERISHAVGRWPGEFFESFLDHFSDVFFEGLLGLILLNFGAALDPKGTLKFGKNGER